MKTKNKKITARLNYKYLKNDGSMQILFECRNYFESSPIIRISILDNERKIITVSKENINKGIINNNPKLNIYLEKMKYKLMLTLDYFNYRGLKYDKKEIEKLLYYEFSTVLNFYEFVEDGEDAQLFIQALNSTEKSIEEDKQRMLDLGINKPVGIIKCANYYKFDNAKEVNKIIYPIKSFFKSINQKDVSVQLFDKNFFDKFIRFLITNGYEINNKQKFLQVSTLQYLIKLFFRFFKNLEDKEYKINQSIYNFKLISGNKQNAHINYIHNDKGNVFALFSDEFETIKNAKFRGENKSEFNRTRDLFIIQVLAGGLRNSELIELKKESFLMINNQLTVILTTKKQAKTLQIPAPKQLQILLEKYKYNIEDLFYKSNGIYNNNLKEMAKYLKLNREILQYENYTNSDKPTHKLFKLHELFSSKLARKTLISILYATGNYQLHQIATITGHSMGAIEFYVSLLTNEKAEMMEEL